MFDDPIAMKDILPILNKWNAETMFKSQEQFDLLRGKLQSVLVFGNPHSAGVMFQRHTSVARLASIISMYSGLETVTKIDILGMACYVSELEIVLVPAFCLEMFRQADQNEVIALCKFHAHQYGIAEDGGKLPKGKGKNQGKGNRYWTKDQNDKDANDK